MAFKNKSLNIVDKKSKLLGAYIRWKREEENMSISFFSDILNISKSYLSEIEHGKKNPTDYTLKQILKILETEYYYNENILIYLHDNLIMIYEKITLLRLDEAKNIIDDIIEKEDYYLSSEGFLIYFLIKLINSIQYEYNYENCNELIKVLREHLVLLDREVVAIFHDIVATFYIQEGMLENAQFHLEEGLEQASPSSSTYAMILYHSARLFQIDGNLIKSLDFCKKAKKEFTVKLNYRRILYTEIFEANIYSMFFYFEDAEKKYLQVLEQAELNNFNDVLLTVLDNLSWMKLRNGEYDECIRLSDYSIDHGTAYDEVLLYAPICYLKKGDFDECLKSIKRIENRVQYPLKYLLDGIYYLCLNMGVNFIESLKKFLSNSPSLDKEMKCFIYELMAEYYTKKNNFSEAVKVQKLIIKTIKCM